jgi:hypothetical protein
MKRLLPLLIVLAPALAACNLKDVTVTLECAAPDSSSYVQWADNGDSLSLHCFQRANP